jgi:type II secretory pathway component PulF
MLTTGERTGSMDAVLLKVADYMDEEADATIHKLGIALFVLAILVVAAIVLVVAVRFYSGYFSNIMGAGGG